MHITQESDYAVRITYCLAKAKSRKDARTISDEVNVPLRFSLKILRKLVLGGIVKSYKGSSGGYELARTSKAITLLDVITAIEGTYKFSRCVGEGNDTECSRGRICDCIFRDVFGEITDVLNKKMASINFQDLLKRENCE